MTKREGLREASRPFSGVRNMRANLIDNAFLQAYDEIHSAALIPATLTLDGETYTWLGGKTEDPNASLTRWRGRPAAIMAGATEMTQVRVDELVRRRSRVAGDSNQGYAVNERGIRGIAYAIGDGGKIALVDTLAAGTVLTIWHYRSPAPLTSSSSLVMMPSGITADKDFTDVLVLKTIWLVSLECLNQSIPGFGIQRVQAAKDAYDERFAEMRAWLNSDENIPHIRTGGQMVRLTKSITDEFLRAVD